MNKRFLPALFLTLVLVMPRASLYAYDWGLLLNQTAGIADAAGTLDKVHEGFSYTGSLIPWFSIPIGSITENKGNLFLSAGFSLEYQNENVIFIPELLRTELSYNFNNGMELHAGRMYYSDPLGFIASGLFDGAHISMGLGGFGTIGIGAWYTGLLYKKNTRLFMTELDHGLYSKPVEYSDFVDTYFAPRRVIAAINWEKPDLSEKFRLKGFLIGQFDLTDNDELYHSQYLGVQFMYPLNNWLFQAGAVLAFAEHKENNENQFEVSAAGEIGVGWQLPTKVQDRLTLTARFSSGKPDKADSSFGAFVPITTQYQGDILRAKLSALSMIRLDYTIRPCESLLLNLADSYFILSDLGTYEDYLGEKGGHFLGNEISANVTWFPLSDLQLNLLGGVFLPSWGNALKESNVPWRIELNARIAIF